jgi:WXG100 family type VII secretion target
MSAGSRFELREADVVGSHAQHVNDVKDQIFSQLRQLISDLEPMSSDFQGAAGTAFQNLKAEYADKQSGLDEVLGRVALALGTAHNNYMTGEDEGSQDQRTVMAETSSISNRINPQI